MKPYLVFESKKTLECVFCTIVIRNQALNDKYVGGLKGFLEDMPTFRCNRHITLKSYFDRIDTVKIENTLKNEGLIFGKDYIIFEADNFTPASGCCWEKGARSLLISPDTPWLKGRHTHWGIDVWYVVQHENQLTFHLENTWQRQSMRR